MLDNGWYDMLEVKNLHVEVEDKQILNGIDLNVKAGEMHAIMGLSLIHI